MEQGQANRPKPPLRPKHLSAIRTRLKLEKRIRDLALSSHAIDCKLHGRDAVAIGVGDYAPRGHAIDNADAPRKKPGGPVKFVETDLTRESLDASFKAHRREAGKWLTAGRGIPERPLTTPQ